MARRIKYGNDGWIAITIKEFTLDNIELVTKAIGAYIKSKYGLSLPVVVGYDSSSLDSPYARYVVDVFKRYGFDVLFAETKTPIHMITHLTENRRTSGALMLMKDQKRAEYYNIRYIPPKKKVVLKNIIDTIDTNIKKLQDGNSMLIRPVTIKGKVHLVDIRQEYHNRIKRLCDILVDIGFIIVSVSILFFVFNHASKLTELFK